MMWPSETEKATKWDLFLPCRATCKVRIPRDSGEKKPTETGWFFNYWWWVWTRVRFLSVRTSLTDAIQSQLYRTIAELWTIRRSGSNLSQASDPFNRKKPFP